MYNYLYFNLIGKKFFYFCPPKISVNAYGTSGNEKIWKAVDKKNMPLTTRAT